MMNYQNYFKEWKNWGRFDEQEKEFEGLNGVYAFRLTSNFGRLRGASSILYIGKCDQNRKKEKRPSGLWYRLKNYKQNNPGSSTRLKEIEKEFRSSNVEYSYVVCENPHEIEKKLLDNYERQHLELPPLNRSR
jgi:hypothetical protein